MQKTSDILLKTTKKNRKKSEENKMINNLAYMIYSKNKEWKNNLEKINYIMSA